MSCGGRSDNMEFPPIRVYCFKCQDWVYEDEVEVTGIEEDFQGRDVLAFVCPECNSNQKSFRTG
jgi:Zn finger protein HypA/HybF involved in hydrogenase expression